MCRYFPLKLKRLPHQLMATVWFLHIKILYPALQQTAGCQVCLICITCMHYHCWRTTRSRDGTCLTMINELIQFMLFNTKLRGRAFACTDMNMLMAQFFLYKAETAGLL